MPLSTQTRLFFNVEINNKEGTQPATLISSLESLQQAPSRILTNWCGYRALDLYQEDADNIAYEVITEVNRLIKKHGPKKQLQKLLTRSHS
jgi:hypothetical protein